MTLGERLRASEIAERLAAIDDIVGRACADNAELEALLDCLDSERKLEQRRAAEALATLGRHGVRVQPLLIVALDSPRLRRCWGAAFALALLGALPREAVPVLLKTLGADDGDLRWAAAEVLVDRVSELGALPELLMLLRQGTPVQRRMAAYCLRDAAVRSSDVELALLQRLEDTDSGVRLAAIAALAQVACTPSAVAQHLTTLLTDPDVGVCRAAAAALGNLGERSESVVAALRAAAALPDPSLQRAVIRSLRMLGS